MSKKFAVIINATEDGKEKRSGYMKLTDNFGTAHWSSDVWSLNSIDHFQNVLHRIKNLVKEKEARKTFNNNLILPYLLSFLFPDGYTRAHTVLNGKVQLVLFSFEGTLLDLKTEEIVELSFTVKQTPNPNEPPEIVFLEEIDHTNIDKGESRYDQT